MAGLEHTLWVTEKVNEAAGPAVVAVLDGIGRVVGFNIPYNPVHPIPQEVIQTWIMISLFGLVGHFTTRKLSVENPSGFFQHMWESVVGVIDALLEDVVGHGSRRFFPFIAGLSLFILGGNLLGLFPFSASPTSTLNTTLACALVAFIYYHAMGIKTVGLKKYAAHFAGPAPALAPLMVPIELVSHLSRVLSLSLRLFGNIMGEDVVILILFSISAYIAPVPMMAFAVFTSFLQAFIFVMLTMMYLAGAVAEDH